MKQEGIFISYSHKDIEWLEKLSVHLKPMMRGEKITIWDDRQIQPGTDWEKEINNKIASSRVAILLVTPNFLASDFIQEQELPKILEQHYRGHTTIFWIAISYSNLSSSVLRKIQCANDPDKPIDSLSSSQQNKVLAEIAGKIENHMGLNAIAHVLNNLDEFTPKQDAFVQGIPESNVQRDFSMRSVMAGNNIEVVSGEHVFETITADDFSKLSDQDQTLIRTYERAMLDLMDRWNMNYPKTYADDPGIRSRAQDNMKRIREQLCQQLTHILDFLASLGKQLDDHYGHVRYVCQQPIT